MQKQKVREQVCFILDLDGYNLKGNSLRGTFYVQELGYCTHNCDYGRIAFDTGIPYRNRWIQDRKTVRHVNKYICGLPYEPDPEEEALSQDRVRDVIQRLYSKYCMGKRTLIAYKGGRVEKDILDELNIPSFNLELIGCPKYDHLNTIPKIKSCGFHRSLCRKSHKKGHCSVQECHAFWRWLYDI